MENTVPDRSNDQTRKPRSKKQKEWSPYCTNCGGKGINLMHKMVFGGTIPCSTCKGSGYKKTVRKMLKDMGGEDILGDGM